MPSAPQVKPNPTEVIEMSNHPRSPRTVAPLPPGGSAPAPPTATEGERRAIRERFFESPWGRALETPARRHVVDALLDLAGDGDDPLRWTRARVDQLDLAALADDAWFEAQDLAAVPDLLRALIGFAHDERGIAPAHTDAAMAAVEWASRIAFAPHLTRPDPWLSTRSWERAPLDRLAAQVGSRAILRTLDDAPLPDEPFQRDGILPEVLPAAEAVLPVVDDVCDRFFDVELRTAARRLLAAIARRSGAVLRRGRTDTTAAGIVWLAATANRACERRGVRYKEVAAHLGLSSALSSRAHTLLNALTSSRGRRPDELGDARLLTSARRRELIEERDLLVDDDPEPTAEPTAGRRPRLQVVHHPSGQEHDHLG